MAVRLVVMLSPGRPTLRDLDHSLLAGPQAAEVIASRVNR
jgi:hypothetical protein